MRDRKKSALGRLGCFFTAADRGPIMTRLTGLPLAYPVANASGIGLPRSCFRPPLWQR